MNLSIIIPCRNEATHLQHTAHSLVNTLEQAGISFELIMVDDGSRDQTPGLLERLQQADYRIRHVTNSGSNGFGLAVREGLRHVSGDAVAVFMGDLSDSPQDVVRCWHKLRDGFDCVFGSRFMEGASVVDYPAPKLLLNRAANLLIRWMFNIPLNDTTNAFKMYRREVIDGIGPLFSRHFNLTVELPLKAIVRGYSYAILPVCWKNRSEGVSKWRIKEMGSRYLLTLLAIWLEKILSRGDDDRVEEPLHRRPGEPEELSTSKHAGT